jgi:hypothetical protein
MNVVRNDCRTALNARLNNNQARNTEHNAVVRGSAGDVTPRIAAQTDVRLFVAVHYTGHLGLVPPYPAASVTVLGAIQDIARAVGSKYGR